MNKPNSPDNPESKAGETRAKQDPFDAPDGGGSVPDVERQPDGQNPSGRGFFGLVGDPMAPSPKKEKSKKRGDRHLSAKVSRIAGEPSHPFRVGLADVPLEYWKGLDKEQVTYCYHKLQTYFGTLLEELRAQSNDAVAAYDQCVRRHHQWRLTIIVATALLAIINMTAAGTTLTFTLGSREYSLAAFCTVLAAYYAVMLTLLSNLESYLGYPERKASARETRELYLDAYRTFEAHRLTYILPYSITPQACHNYNILYVQLLAKELELRRKVLQRGTTQRSGGNKQP